MTETLFDIGLRIRKEVLGEEYVDQALKGADSFTVDLQKLTTEFCWGSAWSGEALSRKQRSLHNLCMLAALNRSHEFKIHFRGALHNGCTLDEIRETLIQISVYCGIPAGMEAFRLGREVLRDEGIEVPPLAEAIG